MDNYGNDGSLEAMLVFLRKTWPDARYSCVCIDPGKVGRDYAIDTVSIGRFESESQFLRAFDKVAGTIPRKLMNWLTAIRHIRKFDVLIVPGTSTLCDYRASPFGAPYALFRWASAARLCGVPLYFVSTGAGPIHHSLSRAMLKYVARSARYRSFRDTVSKDYLTGLGIDTQRDAVYPDLAFKLPTPSTAPSAPRPPTVGLGLMDYNGWHGHIASDAAVYSTYLMKMVKCAISLLDQGYRIRLLVGEVADERAVADLRLILERRGYGSDSRQIVTEPVRSLHDLMRQMQDTDVVVAARYHNVICALRLAKPTISIGYEAKHDALMADFGLTDFCHHIERLDVHCLLEQIAGLACESELYTDRIRRKLVDIDYRLLLQEQRLTDLL